MREALICEPVRTPIGRYGGVFKDVSAVDLGVQALTGLISRTSVPPERIDDVIFGHCNSNGEGPAIGRVVALDAGLPVSVPGQHLDRRCGSGLQAIINAAMAVSSGAQSLVVAGGVESMSNAAFYSTDMRWGGAKTGVRVHDGLVRPRETAGGSSYPVPGGMLETAENLRDQYAISREKQDELAAQSHARAIAAQQSGIFAEEIIGVQVNTRGNTTLVIDDEHPRADAVVEKLATLRPIRIDIDPGSTVTAGNSSGQNDAAAMCLVADSETVAELGLTPLVRLVSWAVAGVPPSLMGIGPVPATARALGHAGLVMADLDTIELNEAFAVQALAVMEEWDFSSADRARVNQYGSGISLGHPVGATGARMVGSLARDLVRSSGRYGLVTMCIGGGQGLAAIFERVEG